VRSAEDRDKPPNVTVKEAVPLVLLAEWTCSKRALFISLIALAGSTRSVDQLPGSSGARALPLAEGFVEIAQGLSQYMVGACLEVFPDPLGDGGFSAPGHDHLPLWIRVPPWVRAAQYAVRRDGSGSVAHDDRMILADEEAV
jgi:hypothetical protein